MKRIAMVVEGLGDRKAFPSLVAKTANMFQKQVYVVRVVEGGGWEGLKSGREFERCCLLASSDGNPDEVLVTVDLDDLCAKSEYEAASVQLVQQAANACGIPVRLCFCVREYESWFLEGLDGIVASSPDFEWRRKALNPGEQNVRAAKETFASLMGQAYRQSIDQEKFTKRLDLAALLGASRSFRKFTKEVIGLEYNQLLP